MTMSERSPKSPDAFTLVEILVSTAVVALLLVILLSITSQVTTMYRHTTSRVEQFRQAREAFDAINRRLGRATLNPYWDYDNPSTPTNYVRQSELRFASGRTETVAGSVPSGKRWPTHGVFFQAPLGTSEPGQTTLSGLNSLLNTWGYFVEFGSDAAFRPSILDGSPVQPRYRFRLCELIQPADELSIYQYTSGKDSSGQPKNLTYAGSDWFSGTITQTASSRPVHVLAENVIALVLLPRLSTQEDAAGTRLAPDYLYDSTTTRSDADINPKNQLPPLVQVTMVALDETSARRLETATTMPDLGLDQLFQTADRFETDLGTLEKTLRDKHLSYRVFTGGVRLKEAKWSKEQQN